MNYIATLTLNGTVIMRRHARTRHEAIEAVGGIAGPGYRIEVERVGVLG
jgi:hypothetical protein